MAIYPYSQWKHCPVCSSPLTQVPVEGNPQVHCDKCDFVNYDSPWPGTIVLLETPDQEVLLLRRAIDPHAGSWDTPGGFINAGETVVQCAAREVLEETGLVVDDLQLLSTFSSTYGEDGHPLLGIALVGSFEGEPTLRDGENSEWGVFSYSNLPPIPLRDCREALQLRARMLGYSSVIRAS